MKFYKKLLLITAILLAQTSFGQPAKVGFEQLDSLQKVEKRPVVVFLHTSWCKYCGIMKNTSLKNKEVEQLLQQKFYFIALDIEEKNPILFRGHTFRYQPNGNKTGVHELAESLGTINGSIAYPGICFLNSNYEIIYQKEGYVSGKDLLKILNTLTFL